LQIFPIVWDECGTSRHIKRSATVASASANTSLRDSARDTKSFIEEEVHELSKRHCAEQREEAIQAGFDGVELHGANYVLINSFFLRTQIGREDYWGGTLEKRMTLSLAVVGTPVKEAIKTSAEEKPVYTRGYEFLP